MYLELHAASAFSFLDGASLPEALVDRAAELGYPALALLDRDGVYGAPRFHKAAKAAGIKPIVGSELTISSAPASLCRATRIAHSQLKTQNPQPFSEQSSYLSPERFRLWRLPVLVESQEGYRNLCRVITRMKLRSAKGEGWLAIEELEGSVAGLVALVGRESLAASRHGVGGLIDRVVGIFGRPNVYVELQRHFLRHEEADNDRLIDLAAAFHVPLLATNGVRFAAPADRPLYDVLTCIRHRTTLEKGGRLLSANAERYLKPAAEMEALFHDRPDALEATKELGLRLQYTLADLGYRFPAYQVPPGETMNSFLRKMTDLGARDRYRPYHERARAQVARELDLIEKLDLAGYFLIVWDIVNFCRERGILVQGRGSAANSAVCYSLGITAVDPVGMDLLFERFLSEERGEWPDIDLDLPSGDRREQVIQHVYEKYGQHGAAMTANVITYRGRSAAREVGKVLGFEAEEIDRLSKVMGHFEFRDPAETFASHATSIGLDVSDPRIQLFGSLWKRIQDLPRHLGQHSGGMVICQDQLDTVVPLENASMPDRVVVQWDKDDCADMGIVKIDLLGLGMMAVLQDTFEVINRERPGDDPMGLWNLPQDDPAVYSMLQQADTMGVFQVESRAQMATLPRLKPERFYDIVVEVAIIRPGPIVGQMVHPYLNRRAGREPVVYPHPSLEPILARTLGVPLFQEQLLRIAMVAAGFTGGQAEELRRAFGFKRSERRMKAIEVQLRDGMAKKGITGAAADEIIKSITSFALYGFPESHSASFALLVYASAYLKAHYPAAFFMGLLNNQPMGFYHPATLVKDAQRRGVRFAGVDVEKSDWLCTVEPDGTVRLGLCYVNGLRAEVGRAIEAAGRRAGPGAGRGLGAADSICPKCGSDDRSMLERVSEGPPVRWFCNTCAHDWAESGRPARRFASVDDLARRTGATREELATLAEIGALSAFGHTRREALWQVERAARPAGKLYEGLEDSALPSSTDDEQFSHVGSFASALRASTDRQSSDLRPPCPLPPMSARERVVADYDGTGLTIGPHPMAMRRRELSLKGVLPASDLARERHGRRVRVAGMVITRQRPGTAKGFVFLTLEDETGISNIIVRPDLFERERLAIIGAPFLVVEGPLQNQDGVVSVRADRLESLGGLPNADARNFY
ncbi:MAG: DNA polymerase III subunit alpha [Vicinamibacterales bacterium]